MRKNLVIISLLIMIYVNSAAKTELKNELKDKPVNEQKFDNIFKEKVIIKKLLIFI